AVETGEGFGVVGLGAFEPRKAIALALRRAGEVVDLGRLYEFERHGRRVPERVPPPSHLRCRSNDSGCANCLAWYGSARYIAGILLFGGTMMSEFANYPSLKGVPVVVSGGATGIGEGIVRAFAEQGSKVGFVDI